jgi:hypothetical protein
MTLVLLDKERWAKLFLAAFEQLNLSRLCSSSLTAATTINVGRLLQRTRSTYEEHYWLSR